jgi:hypothetical protein
MTWELSERVDKVDFIKHLILGLGKVAQSAIPAMYIGVHRKIQVQSQYWAKNKKLETLLEK